MENNENEVLNSTPVTENTAPQENVKQAETAQTVEQPQAVPNAGSEPKNPTKLPVEPKVLAIIGCVVVLLLIFLIPALAKSSTEGKVKKALKVYIQVFETGEKDPDDIKWRKYYPKFIEDDVEDWAEDLYDSRDRYDAFDDMEYKILSITKLSGKDTVKQLQELVEDYGSYTFDLRKSDIKNLKVSAGYIIIFRDDSGRDPEFYSALVLKVNGRYGVYGVLSKIL